MVGLWEVGGVDGGLADFEHSVHLVVVFETVLGDSLGGGRNGWSLGRLTGEQMAEALVAVVVYYVRDGG